MSNVRFYRLGALPNFDSSKHVGIFVHVTTGDNTHKAGLWFGGAASWEYLTNDTDAINAAIVAKIQDLDVPGYGQATISTTDTTNEKSSTLTIKGIQEVDGEISEATNLNFNVAIDGVYNSSTNKIATQSTVTNAINGLNAETVQAVTFNTAEIGGNTTLTFNGVKETNGVIAQGDGASTFIVGDAKLNIEIGADNFEVFSANAKSDGAIKLDENVFKKNVVNGKNVLSVITKNNDVSSTNPLVTKNDIASLNGAMHYKNAIASDSQWPTTVKAGDVYIASGNFEHGDGSDAETIESGDLIVFNTDSVNDYTVVQSNITLGTGVGQVAANTEGLTNGNLVVATDKGIKTTGISASVLEETNNTRDLTYSTITGKGIVITDSLKIMNRDFNKSINIVSENDSIQITVEKDDQADKGVKVDLVWNTSIK